MQRRHLHLCWQGEFDHVDHNPSADAQEDEIKFEADVEAAESPTAIVALLIKQHRKVKLEISTAFSHQISLLTDALSAAQVKCCEAEDQVDEMHRVLGPAALRAHQFIKRRLNAWRLRRSLSVLLEHGPSKILKRIECAKTGDCVITEMVNESDSFSDSLDFLGSDILQPIHNQFLAPKVGTEADPNGWELHEFEVFMKAVQTLHTIHATALLELKTHLNRKKLVAVSSFYLELAKHAYEPLVLYLNRLTFVKTLLRTNESHKNYEGVKLKDFLWSSERKSTTRVSTHSRLFGVLQATASWTQMLKRLQKLTPKSHISYTKLAEAHEEIDEMMQKADRACREYTELKAVQKSLHQSPVYFVRENRKVWHQGGTFTLGIVENPAVVARDATPSGCTKHWIGDRLITDPCHLILLTTMLLMCEPICLKIPNLKYRKNSKRQPKDIDVVKYVVRRLVRKPESAEDCKLKSYEGNVFSIECQGLILFKCASIEDKEQWMVRFIEAWQTPVETCCPNTFRAAADE